MRLIRIAVLLVLLALPLVVTSGASALDICEEPHCQPPPAEQNTPYEFEFEAEEGCLPYRFSYLNGTVPPGLTITQDGKLTGTPTQAGRFDFWVGLDDAAGPQNPNCQVVVPQSQGHYFMTVLPDLAVTTQSLPLAGPGQQYRAQLEFSNPEPGWPVVWDLTQGSLPQGLSLSAEGVISGTASGPDLKTFTVRAREPFRRFGERQLTLAVAQVLQARSAARAGEVGLRYAGSVPATGGLLPLAWSVASGTIPHGLSLNPTTGAIRGIPRKAGVFQLTFAVTDAAGQRATVATTIRIAPRLAVKTARLPAATSGETYRASLVSTGGLGPERWSITHGALPDGLRLDPKTGVISGVAHETGVFRITVQVRDRLGAKSSKRLRLSVIG